MRTGAARPPGADVHLRDAGSDVEANQQAQPLSSRQASDQAVVMVFAIIQKAHDWFKMLELLQ